MAEPLQVPLDQPVIPINAPAGTEIVLRGSLYVRHDGTVIDATSTAWPKESPGGASIDKNGLFDLEGGGLRLTAQDPAAHEYHVVVTGDAAPACAAAGLPSACLVNRASIHAHDRLMSLGDFIKGADGGLTATMPETLLPPVPPSYEKAAYGVLGALVVALVGWAVVRRRRRFWTTAEGQLLALAKRVRSKAKGADPVLSAPLIPAVDAALRILSARHVDALSNEGKRVREVLIRVEARLDTEVAEARAEAEKKVADELVQEMEASLAAAEEVGLAREVRR